MTEPAPAIDPERLRRTVTGMLGSQSPANALSLEEGLRAVLQEANDAGLARLLDRMATTGEAWGYHPPDPLARRLGRVILRTLLVPGSRLHDAHYLKRAAREPVLLLGNHLSFVDANLFEHLVAEAGFPGVSQRITTLVGPKVYTQPLRRLASLCFGAVKLPQSPSRASEEAMMAPREAARLAAEAIRTAHARHTAGDHLLVFVEGSRSRTGAMQRSLAAVARYLERPARWLIPFALWGSEKLARVGDDRMYPARVRARVGPPVETEELFARCRGKRPLLMDTVGCRIAELLPPEYRGAYGESDPSLGEAREIARRIGAREPTSTPPV